MREIERAGLARCALARWVNDDEAGADGDVGEARGAVGWRCRERGEFGEQQFAHEALEHEELAQDGEARAAG